MQSYFPDVVSSGSAPPTADITVQAVTVDEAPPPPSPAEPPQPAYAASYGRKDAEVVAALIEGLLPGTGPTVPPTVPSSYSVEGKLPPGYVAVPAAWLDGTTQAPTVTYTQAPPPYSVEGKLPPGYAAVPISWLDRIPGAKQVGRSQYETFPEPQQQQFGGPNQQFGGPHQQFGGPQAPRWSQNAQFDAPPRFAADNSALTGRTSIGTLITDPNVYFPEANGALYLGAPQTVFYARPRQLPREPLIVGATPDWALGPQRLFKWDPRTPAAAWYGQSLAPLVPGAQRSYPIPYQQNTVPYPQYPGYGSQPAYVSGGDAYRSAAWGRR